MGQFLSIYTTNADLPVSPIYYDIFPEKRENDGLPSPDSAFIDVGKMAFVNISVNYEYKYDGGSPVTSEDFGYVAITDENFDVTDPDAVRPVVHVLHRLSFQNEDSANIRYNRGINFSTKVVLKAGQRISMYYNPDAVLTTNLQVGGYITDAS